MFRLERCLVSQAFVVFDNLLSSCFFLFFFLRDAMDKNRLLMSCFLANHERSFFDYDPSAYCLISLYNFKLRPLAVFCCLPN